jgi:hypothetical protein
MLTRRLRAGRGGMGMYVRGVGEVEMDLEAGIDGEGTGERRTSF